MKALHNGRYCDHCQKEVIDFTGMTDAELFKYLQSHQNICGRFYEDQLQRNITVPVHKKFSWKQFPKVAAGLLAFFSLKNIQAEPVKKKSETIQAPFKRYDESKRLPDTLGISGTVTDDNGTPLADVEVSWNNLPMTKTDAYGKFYFIPIIADHSRSCSIIFSYPDLVNAVRSYHPSMGSTSYSVTLSPPTGRRITMGAPVTERDIINDLALRFDFSKTEMTDVNKVMLAVLASTLRNHPDISVELAGAGKDSKALKKMKELQQAIKKYLINMEGIGGDRIIIKTVDYIPSLEKIIEFRDCSKD